MIKRLLELLFPSPATKEQSLDRDVVTKVVYKTVEPKKELQTDYSFKELSLEHPSALEQSDLTYIINNEDYDDFEKNLQKYIHP
jgi:hypothetical protein